MGGGESESGYFLHTLPTLTLAPRGELYHPSGLEGTLWSPYEAMPILTTHICSRLRSGLSELPSSAAYLCKGVESAAES